MYNIVWILGAGFSKGLGGPLLQNLFTEGSKRQLQHYFPDARLLQDRPSIIARDLYKKGHNELLWSNPEEFLDFLDAAVDSGKNSGPWGLINHQLRVIAQNASYPQPSVELVASASRRLLAAECSAFLVNANTASERWAPYLDWAAQLSGKYTSDTIISFNYDRVLECLRSRLGTNRRSGVMHIDSNGAYRSDSPFVNVFKLHGSIDWKRGSDEKFHIQTDNPFFAISAADDELAIATPGPRKHTTVTEFQKIWHAAEYFLADADHIVFLGYRFPPTDAEARQRLLGTIRRCAETKHPHFHIVLGPNTSSPDVVRLAGLLEFTRSPDDTAQNKGVVHKHPMYAEDFLSVYNAQDFNSRYDHWPIDQAPT